MGADVDDSPSRAEGQGAVVRPRTPPPSQPRGAYPRRFSVDLATVLTADFDAARQIALMPRHYTTKGMFFPGLLRHLPPGEWHALRGTLLAPPRFDKYLPFADYPIVDLVRVNTAAAARAYPGVALSEGLRRVCREDMTIFSATNPGRVLLALVGDTANALLKAPQVIESLLKGGSVAAERRADAVTFCVRGFPLWAEGPLLGTLEGVVVHFGDRPRLEVELISEFDADIAVRWGA
ncbi:MAG TPA: DUF2378 family protein [Polyangiaceae bacterium]|nr:DUF2378 family protein [Polyangiaceae bacterium]